MSPHLPRAVDVDCSGCLDFNELLQLLEVCELPVIVVDKVAQANRREEYKRQMQRESFMLNK